MTGQVSICMAILLDQLSSSLALRAAKPTQGCLNAVTSLYCRAQAIRTFDNNHPRLGRCSFSDAAHSQADCGFTSGNSFAGPPGLIEIEETL